jgi:hypothetical protein
MGCRRCILSFLVIPVLLGSAGGCGLFHTYVPVTVLVRDAETKKPIEGAQVDIFYLFMLNPFAPSPSAGKTGPDGMAALRAAPFFPCLMSVDAEGYGGQQIWLAESKIRELKAQARTDQPTFTVDLFSNPGATIELIVPVEFRGLIKLDLEEQASEQQVPGRRRFECMVPASGIAQVRGPMELLHGRVCRLQYEARASDGLPIPTEPQDDEVVGLRLMTSFGMSKFFVIGTDLDRKDSEKLIYKFSHNGSSKSLDVDLIRSWTVHQLSRQ